MDKKSNIVAAVLLSGVLGWVVARDIRHFAQTEAIKTTAPFTPAQEARIGEVVANYLIAHPELLARINETLEARPQVVTEKVQTLQSELLHDPQLPSYDSAETKVMMSILFGFPRINEFCIAADCDSDHVPVIGIRQINTGNELFAVCHHNTR